MKKLIFLGMCLMFVFASCAKQSAGTGKYRSAINIALTAQPPTLDAIMTPSQAALTVAAHIFEPLYTLNAAYEPVPDLAEGVTISDDKLNYTFTLRKGILFHNGKELKSDDVTASMNRWLANSSRAKSLLAGAKFEKIDDYTVRLTVASATQDVLIILSTWAQFPAIMPLEIVESIPAGQMAGEFIGTGPYKFSEWKQDQYIKLERYENFKSRSEEPSGFSGKKTAPTEFIYFQIVTDQSTRVAGLKTGEYDVTQIPSENYEEFEKDEAIKIYSAPGGVLSAYFNTEKGPFANIKLRQAALAAFNDKEILLASFSNPELYFLNPGFTNPEQAQWLVEGGKEYYNQANPDKAKKLLAEAGYKNEEITILATPDYSEMYAASLVIQEELKQAGFNVKLVSFDFPTWMKMKADTANWSLFTASTAYQLTPPQLLVVTPDWAGLRAKEVTEGIKAIRGAANAQDAKAAWSNLQKFIYEDAAATSIGHYIVAVGAKKSFEGFESFMCPVLWNARLPE